MKIVYSLLMVSLLAVRPIFPYDDSHIHCVDVYPKEWHNVYFKTIPYIALDEIGNIYAVDNRTHVFYKIDVISDEAQPFSGPGQGPGELQNPLQICATPDNIFIKDNVGINIFSLGGKFINRFRVFTRIISFAIDGQHVLLATTGDEKLIKVCGFNGKILTSFGEKYGVPRGIYEGWPEEFIEAILNTGKIIAGRERVYFVSYLFSELYGYDRSGALNIKKTIEEDDQIVKESQRYYFVRGQKRPQEKGGFHFYQNKYLVIAACAFDGKLFFLQEKGIHGNAKEMKILEIREKDMNKIKSYRFEAERGDAFEDFCVGGPNKVYPDFYFSVYDTKRQEFLIKKFREVLK